MSPQTALAIVLASCLLAPGFAQTPPAQGGLAAPTNPRCEYLTNPLGIDAAAPRLSWEMADPRRGAKQTAYQVLVADNPRQLDKDAGNLWDSGKVASDQSIQVVYQGKPLQSKMRAWWKVRVWDKDGQPSAWSAPASWSMGLLNPSDWKAKWIGDATPPPARTPAHNGYHSETAKTADAAKWIVIDLEKSETPNAVTLYPARPFDWKTDEPGFLFPLRFKVEMSETADFQNAKTVVDQTAADVPKPGAAPQTYVFPPTQGRYVRLTVTKLGERAPGEFGFALAEMQVLFGGDKNLALQKPVSVGTHQNAKGETVPDSIERNAWSTKNLVDGDLISHPLGGQEPSPPPLVRKAFKIASGGSTPPIRRVTAYVTALGAYELHLNGQRVGDQILAPGWTDYLQRVLYQTYDVTSLIKPGDNVVAAQLGDGWYAGRIGLSGIVPNGPKRRIYGPQPRFLLQLEIERADGQTQRLVSDESWKYTTEGPIRVSDILDGETYDARREMPGWDAPGFDDSTWKYVAAADIVANDVPEKLRTFTSPHTMPPDTDNHPQPKFQAQSNEPIRVIAELKPIAVNEPKPGIYVFDLGQNMVGWCRFKLKGAAGQTIKLHHAEVLNNDGTIFTANLRSAGQTDQYICKGGGEETFEPHFTYHGFRYVEVTGLTEKPALDALTGRVFCSAAPETGKFECSNPMLNKLVQNILWTQRANMESVPTDCPQRDERCGWMGDILAFAQTACFNMDMAAFYTKWIPDIRDAQADDGRFPDFAPHPYGKNERFTGTPAWGDAGVFVPWTAYRNYGDMRLLQEQYDAAKRWVEYIHSKNPDLIWNNGRGNQYGDWLTADTFKIEGYPKTGANTPPEVFATIFFARSTELLSDMARVLGKEDDAKKYAALAADIRTAFNKAFVTPDGKIKGETQGGYALALQFGLIPENLRAAAAKHMVEGFAPYKGNLSTGFHSTGPLMLQLVKNGYLAEAYRLATNRTMPSWGYLIDHGATTIWERWDGHVEGAGFQDSGMNSFSHYAFGAVGEWLYRTVAGINLDDAIPAYKHFILRPRPGGGLTWANAEYHSIQGQIVSRWKLDSSTLTLECTIPANTTATVYMPAADAAKVTESGQPADKAEGVQFVRMEDEAAVYRVGAGSYKFNSTVAPASNR